jgi:alkylation response protein AidB-like acyl-CoA dehydrogenase
MRDTGLLMMKSPYEVGGAEIHPVDQMAVVEAVTYLDSAACMVHVHCRNRYRSRTKCLER